ncbi:Por secretion system C-terminal sorting domain-containing protein [Hymenobacter gelipurpurascens]|uniref:Por secretion system C-terminal sorting domain-containing protein n=1 Tax=Hymenobacter gelipurpurascens TaxID=89968 RepID=A0A212TMD5_9BACT|nr:T9SS type A sorting domain-containing protein [Hymenobacter gelipurpurascens]SNC67219.1 Por secretion system C-terminal sorting domain-containing protein [Hymenobacter gelipurpurascens]
MAQLYKHLKAIFCLVALVFGSYYQARADYPQTDGKIFYVGGTGGSESTISEYGAIGQNWIRSGGTNWHMTYDDTYLYIGLEGVSSATPVFLYFDVIPGGITSATENGAIHLPFAADVAVRIGSDPISSSIQFASQSAGSQAWLAGVAPASADMAALGEIREIKILLSSLPGGKPTSFNWVGYLGAPASNPAPFENPTGIPDYSYYYNVARTGNTAPFQRLSYTLTATSPSIPTGKFYDYTVNKPGPALNLGGGLTIANSFVIRNTTLNTGANTITLESGAIIDEEDKVNAATNGYVIGKVTATSTLNAAGTFPFGNMGLTLQVRSGTTVTTYPGNTLVTRLTGSPFVSGNGNKTVSRFFFIDPSVFNASVGITMTLHYAQSELNALPSGSLSFFKATLPPSITIEGAAFSELGRDRGTGANAGDNTVILSGIELEGIWTLAAKGKPLPVELVQFTGQSEADAVRLRWATATETNNKGFEVQRQTGKGDWKALGFVAGKGSSNLGASYEYLDRSVGAGAAYYRLVQTDYDGKTAYSSVVAIQVSFAKQAALSLYPVPTSSMLHISGSAKESNTVEIYNSKGQRVQHEEVADLQTGISVGNLPAGRYMIRVASEGKAPQSSHFIKD